MSGCIRDSLVILKSLGTSDEKSLQEQIASDQTQRFLVHFIYTLF